jgi:hypothetical protein
MAIQVKDSDLYQNGRIIQLDGGEELLYRTPLPPKQEQTDNYIAPKTGDELNLLAYYAYKDIVKNANQYWWLLADRNEVFNPLALNVIVGDGELLPIHEVELVLPNILKQQPEFSAGL